MNHSPLLEYCHKCSVAKSSLRSLSKTKTSIFILLGTYTLLYNHITHTSNHPPSTFLLPPSRPSAPPYRASYSMALNPGALNNLHLSLQTSTLLLPTLTNHSLSLFLDPPAATSTAADLTLVSPVPVSVSALLKFFISSRSRCSTIGIGSPVEGHRLGWILKREGLQQISQL